MFIREEFSRIAQKCFDGLPKILLCGEPDSMFKQIKKTSDF
jgi:hypothetical protein